jgi:hypothetical protein
MHSKLIICHARIPSKIHDAAKIAADDRKVTFSSIVLSALEEYLDRHGYNGVNLADKSPNLVTQQTP